MEESSAEIHYPSISVCSERLQSTKMGDNQSVIHPSVNLSELITKVELWQRNDTGQFQKIVIEPANGTLENRDNKMSHFYFQLESYAFMYHCFICFGSYIKV